MQLGLVAHRLPHHHHRQRVFQLYHLLQKRYLAGRPKIELSKMEQDTIRLIFHQLLNEKVYPTCIKYFECAATFKIRSFPYNPKQLYVDE